MSKLNEFTKRLNREIPLSKALEALPVELSSDRVVLSAPLAPNINHKLTAFGGSVYAVAVLSAWSLLTVTLKEEGFDVDYVVVQDGTIEYKAPIRSDFTATAEWSSTKGRAKFVAQLKKRGLARATLRSVVREGAKDCARLEARFVAEVSRPS
jgi:thioesterase domain-containing protein